MSSKCKKYEIKCINLKIKKSNSSDKCLAHTFSGKKQKHKIITTGKLHNKIQHYIFPTKPIANSCFC